jgi:hypothetical protein
MTHGKHSKKKVLFKIDSMRKLTNVIFCIGALMGILFGGSYQMGKNFFGILLGALAWGVITGFGFKGVYEFIIGLICNMSNDDPQPEAQPEESSEE